ncbi:homoserine O-succinyltransferase [Bacillus carboniphilus]|uniref:Homoserine O-acetyltransferase n=1 Tax=Bacillus carboniphilus TaxID=86663 RepID=A0ABY9JY18_9BACI|nr:homoserine O-succinyltransferase [Bacillus carboniphilus]WLR43679.1 homoserine O-succinyltransferase [Bacillus carboniphilus]
MPINIPKSLPARKILQDEGVFIMDEERAFRQDIRPLNIIILNLMPEKQKTETQLLRLLSNSPLQIQITLLRPKNYSPKTTSMKHLEQFYTTFDHVFKKKYDGMIITGAPVEQLPFEEVTYWTELCEIMSWSKKNVTSTLHICWGAQASLYYHYGINKYDLPQKCSGIYQYKVLTHKEDLVKGFDEEYFSPHSCHTYIKEEDITNNEDLTILSKSEKAGIGLILSKDKKFIFLPYHPEYDLLTLKEEYERDKKRKLHPTIPKNYFPQDNANHRPIFTWKSHGYLLFSNWLNYFVYQITPFKWS